MEEGSGRGCTDLGGIGPAHCDSSGGNWPTQLNKKLGEEENNMVSISQSEWASAVLDHQAIGVAMSAARRTQVCTLQCAGDYLSTKHHRT